MNLSSPMAPASASAPHPIEHAAGDLRGQPPRGRDPDQARRRPQLERGQDREHVPAVGELGEEWDQQPREQRDRADPRGPGDVGSGSRNGRAWTVSAAGGSGAGRGLRRARAERRGGASGSGEGAGAGGGVGSGEGAGSGSTGSVGDRRTSPAGRLRRGAGRGRVVGLVLVVGHRGVRGRQALGVSGPVPCMSIPSGVSIGTDGGRRRGAGDRARRAPSRASRRQRGPSLPIRISSSSSHAALADCGAVRGSFASQALDPGRDVRVDVGDLGARRERLVDVPQQDASGVVGVVERQRPVSSS